MAIEQRFSLLHNVQTDLGGTEGYFRGGNAAGGVRPTTYFHLMLRLRILGAAPQLHI
jgi:hypothetical protein